MLSEPATVLSTYTCFIQFKLSKSMRQVLLIYSPFYICTNRSLGDLSNNGTNKWNHKSIHANLELSDLTTNLSFNVLF